MRALILGARVAALLVWWNLQGYRWLRRHPDGYSYTDGYAESWARHDLRRNLGHLLQAFFPRISACRECGIPHGLSHWVYVDYAKDTGCFVLCASCWHHLRQYEGGKRKITGHFNAHVNENWDAEYRDQHWASLEREIERMFHHISHKSHGPNKCVECMEMEDYKRRAVATEA